MTSQFTRPGPGDLTGLEVVVDDGGFDFVEVTQSADDLHDNGARLLLRHQLVLLQVEVQVVAFTELQNSAEPRDGPAQSHPPPLQTKRTHFTPSLLCGGQRSASRPDLSIPPHIRSAISPRSTGDGPDMATFALHTSYFNLSLKEKAAAAGETSILTKSQSRAFQNNYRCSQAE